MSESQAQASQSQDKRQSLFFRLLKFTILHVGAIAMLLLVSLIASIIIEVIGAYFIWTELGINNSRNMLHKELSNISNERFHRVILNPIDSTLLLLKATNTSLSDWYAHFIAKKFAIVLPTGDIVDLSKVKDEALLILEIIWNMIRVFIIRCFISIYSLPLLAIFLLVAFIDGLAARDLRRFAAERESGYLFHFTNRLIRPSIIYTIIFLYLSIPTTVEPAYFFTTAYSLVAVAAFLTAKWYKKFL